MAALSTLFPNLADLVKQLDPDGSVADLVEILNQQNDALHDIHFVEGNLPTGNRSVIRAGIPTPTWRKLYGGILPSKSLYATVTDNCGELAALSEVDVKLADLAGAGKSAFLLNEARGQIEGMNQEAMSTFLYGNEGTEPEAFTGLTPRYNSTSANNGDHVILGGSTDTDNQSIWLVYWGPNIHGIFPKGSKAGLQVRDDGEVWVEDASNGSNTGRMRAYRTSFGWDLGLTVRDWRSAVRICNIDMSLLNATGTGSSAVLPDLMFEAMEVIPSAAQIGNPAFYASRTVITRLRQQLANKVANSTLMIEEVGGKKVMTFQGIPIRRVDALAASETLVA